MVLDIGDLAAGETFYSELFSPDVAFREGEYDDEYDQVPDDLDWPAAVDPGVEPGMTFLRRDGFALALTAEPGTDDAELHLG